MGEKESMVGKEKRGREGGGDKGSREQVAVQLSLHLCFVENLPPQIRRLEHLQYLVSLAMWQQLHNAWSDGFVTMTTELGQQPSSTLHI